MTIFEAARWAPSSYNSQPWRFVYARPGHGALGADAESVERVQPQLGRAGGRRWRCWRASETMMVPGKDTPVPSHSHSLDAGSGWGYAALQATKLGWAAHGMVGFDMERARAELGIPAGFRVEMALVIGRPGDKSMLPEMLAAREMPSGRKPLGEVLFEGRFRGVACPPLPEEAAMDDVGAVLTRHRLTIDDVERMIVAGVFDDNRRVELIEGELFDMAPIGEGARGQRKRVGRSALGGVSGPGDRMAAELGAAERVEPAAAGPGGSAEARGPVCAAWAAAAAGRAAAGGGGRQLVADGRGE